MINGDNCRKKIISPNYLFGLVITQKKSSIPSLSWSEAVDEALALVGLTAQERRLTNFRLCSFLASVNPKAIGQKSIKKKFNNSLTAKE